MAKIYKPKGIHTSPDNAGVKNMKNAPTSGGEGYNDAIYSIMTHGVSEGYTGQWTDEELMKSVDGFFGHCKKMDIKPTQPLLRLWLNISRSQLYDWRTKPEKYGGKSDIITMAFDYMEAYLQCNIDKYPTGSIFLLKSSHGHRDKQDIEITSGTDISKSEIDDVVGKLGLGK